MCDIDEIMEMLDWNNSEEIQQKGIELAKNIKSISAFLQPCGKNVWDNCAKILIARSDDILEPYLSELLEWLIDLNWPGAEIILDRLKNYKGINMLSFCVTECTRRAYACNEKIWLDNLAELLDNEKLKEELPKDVLLILNKHYHRWETDDSYWE